MQTTKIKSTQNSGILVDSRCKTLNFELYFYLDTVNLSDKIIILLQSIITVTIYFNLYKHDLKFKSKIEKNKEILLYIDAVCVLTHYTTKPIQFS